MTGRVFIVGAMGAGKTAVGRELARALQVPFHDTDQEICDRTGVDIGYIFEKEGEQGFRKRESQILEDLAKNDHCVIATGGGIVTQQDNCKLMRASGTVIYLSVSTEVQKKRARRGVNRPLLDSENPDQVLAELCEIRTPLYKALADHIIETDNRRVGDVTREVLDKLANKLETPGSPVNTKNRL